MPRFVAICAAALLTASPFQSAYSGSILEVLKNCTQEDHDESVANVPTNPEDNSGQANEGVSLAEGAKKETAAVLLIEFAEIPDPKASLVEKLFSNPVKQGGTPQKESSDILSQRAKLPNVKNVRVDRAVTEGQVVAVSSKQFDGLRQDLLKIGGVSLISPPGDGMKLDHGQEAVANILQARSVVYDVETADGTMTNQSASVNYQTGEVWIGPEARIHSEAVDGGWRLDLSLQYLAFLGYDDPGQFSPQVRAWVPPGEKLPTPLEATQPLPHFSSLESRASVIARAGETVIVRSPLTTDVSKTKKGFLGRDAKHEKPTRLYLFVSLTSLGEQQK